MKPFFTRSQIVGGKMTYGRIVAKRYKEQYFRKRTGWKNYDAWQIQPEQYHMILLELKSKEAIEALVGGSWTNRLPKRKGKQK